MTDRGDAHQAYASRVAACDASLASLRAASGRISTLRVVTFLAAAAALLVVDVAEGPTARAAGGVAALAAAAFIGLVVRHRGIRRRMAWEETLRGLATEGLLRLGRRWRELDQALPPGEAVPLAVPEDHPFAGDLDVVGDASLFRLCGPVTSERGRDRLVEALLEPAPWPDLSLRQEAVRELAPRVELRHAFAAHGRLQASADPPGTQDFLTWAEGDAWLSTRPAVATLAVALPLLLVAGVVADLVLGMPPLWLVPALAQVELLRRNWRRMNADFLLAEDGLALLAAYVPQLRLLEAEAPAASLLRRVTASLGRGSGGASARLTRLARLLSTAESRRNLFYAVLGPAFLVDVHLTLALDRWRRAWGGEVRGWLEAMGTWESLAALSAVAHDHPGWTFPTVVVPTRVDAGEPTLKGEALGHPLLPLETCVDNDVEVGPPGTFLLVTGSNMSGKSTLLRALGANVVLAGAGAPVRARSLTLPPVRVRAVMRVEDSLAEGVSLFMAELLRIRRVVEDADDPQAPPVLYLLDEMLHGTNSAERRVAARAVLRHLLGRRALGAVSTHDLALADAPDLEEAARAVHFRETVEGGGGPTRLSFDYRLRPGLATTRNALKLLDAVGLGELVRGQGPREG